MEKALREALACASADLDIHFSPSAWGIVKREPRSIQVVEHRQREFSMDFWMQGVEYGNGCAKEFADVAESILLFLIQQASLTTLASRFPWFHPHSDGVAHEQGTDVYVSYVWSELERRVACMDLPKSLAVILNLGSIVREAAKRPELRHLRPYTSLFVLCFSRTTGYPFSGDCPHAEPIGNELYRVTCANGTVLLDGVDAVKAADALVDALPPNSGPATAGTAERL